MPVEGVQAEDCMYQSPHDVGSQDMRLSEMPIYSLWPRESRWPWLGTDTKCKAAVQVYRNALLPVTAMSTLAAGLLQSRA